MKKFDRNELLLQISQLPNEPGVYYFLSKEIESPLYIGKSIRIRDRVKSHLYHSKVSARESKLMQSTTHIDYNLTAGELGALLLESQEIKKLKPLYNKRLKKTKDIFYIQINKDKILWTPTITSKPSKNFQTQDEYFGIFSNKKQAELFLIELAKSHQLCLKVLNFEKTNRACFNYQLNKCRGACCGKETISSHNKRLYESLYIHKLYSWPYNGVISINEVSLDSQREDTHYIDQWCYLYSTSHFLSSNNEKIIQSQQKDISFDRDIYNIIRRYIASNPHMILL